jgi:hypothetical protein
LLLRVRQDSLQGFEVRMNISHDRKFHVFKNIDEVIGPKFSHAKSASNPAPNQ